MKTAKELIYFVMGLSILAALGLCAMLFMGLSGNLQLWGSSGFGFFGRAKLANRQVFSAANFSGVSANYSSEKITLLASGNKDEIVLEEYMSKWDSSMLADISTADGKLAIGGGQRKFLPFWDCEIVLYLPANYLADIGVVSTSGTVYAKSNFAFAALDVKSSSGSVRLQNVSCSENISLSTTSGSISAQELVAKQSINLAASSGSIRPESLNAKSIVAKTAGGSVRLGSAAANTIELSALSGGISANKLEGQFNLQTSSGSIRVQNAKGGGDAASTSGEISLSLGKLNGNLNMQTSSGACRLFVQKSESFYFSAQTSSGGIRTPKEANVTFGQKNRQASGTFGADAKSSVSMVAKSGSVLVELL